MTTIVLLNPTGAPLTFDDLLSAGGEIAVFEVAKGELAEFEASPFLAGSLAEGIPVVAMFESDDEAEILAAKRTSRGTA